MYDPRRSGLILPGSHMRFPSGPLMLNRSSPLARGLFGLWPLTPNQRFANLAGHGGGLTESGLRSYGRFPGFPAAPYFTAVSPEHYFEGPIDVGSYPLTVVVWCRRGTLPENCRVVTLSDGTAVNRAGVIVNTNGAVKAFIGNSSVGTPILPANQWHLLGCSYDSGTDFVCWYDGALIGENTSSNPSSTGMDRVTVGVAGDDHATSRFVGHIGPVMFWRRILSPEEHWRLWNPSTRWELFIPQRSKSYFLFATTSAGSGGGQTVTPARAIATSRAYQPKTGIPQTVTPGLASATSRGFSPSLGDITVSPAVARATSRAYSPQSTQFVEVLAGIPLRVGSYRRRSPRPPEWPYGVHRGNPISRGLAGWWSFPSRSFLVNHAGGEPEFSQFGNFTLTRDPLHGTALVFSGGGGSYLHASKSPIETVPATIAVWFRNDGPGDDNTRIVVFSDGGLVNNLALRIRSNYVVRCYMGVSYVSSLNVLPVTQWAFAVAVYRSQSHMEFWIDGKLQGIYNADQKNISGLNQIHMGGSAIDPLVNKFKGAVADVKVWRRALSPGEIRSLWNPATRHSLALSPRGRPTVLLVPPAAGSPLTVNAAIASATTRSYTPSSGGGVIASPSLATVSTRAYSPTLSGGGEVFVEANLATASARAYQPGRLGGGYSPPAGSPMALKLHPRLHVVPDSFSGGLKPTISELRAKIDARFRDEYQVTVDRADRLFTSIQVYDSYANSIVDDIFFVALVGTGIGADGSVAYGHTWNEYRQRARDILYDMATGGITLAPTKDRYTTSDYCQMARGFDWLFDFLSPSDKQTIGGFLASTSADQIMSPWQVGTNLLSSHAYEHDAAWYVAAGVWEPPDSRDYLTAAEQSDAQAGLNRWNEENLRNREGRLHARNYMAREHGGHTEIGNYLTWHIPGWLHYVDGFRTATTFDAATEDPHPGVEAWFIQNLAVFICYLFEPYPMGRHLGLGQRHGYQSGIEYQGGFGADDLSRCIGWSVEACIRAGRSDYAALTRWMLENFGQSEPEEILDEDYYMWWWMLFGDKVAPQSPAQLGLPKWRHHEGQGIFIHRSGWDSPSNVVFCHWSQPTQIVGHGSGPSNLRGLFVSKRGPLLFCKNFQKGAGGSFPSAILVTDPNAPSEDVIDELKTGKNLTDFSQIYGESSTHWIGGMRRWAGGDRWSYSYGDQTPGYEYGVASQGRSHIMFEGASDSEPSYFVVYDRVAAADKAGTGTSAADMLRRWTGSFSFVPTVENVGGTGAPTKTVLAGGHAYGDNLVQYTHTNAWKPRIKIWNKPHWYQNGVLQEQTQDPYSGDDWPSSGGVLWLTFLVPTRTKVQVAGGPGASGFSDHTGDYSVWTDDFTVPYNSSGDPYGSRFNAMGVHGGGAMWCGAYVLDVQPETSTEEVEFLVVGQVDEPTGTAESAVYSTSSTRITAIITDSNRATLCASFSRSSTRTTTASVNAQDALLPARIVFADLEPGNYIITLDGSPLTSKVVGADGVLYLEHSTGGNFFASQDATVFVTPALASASARARAPSAAGGSLSVAPARASAQTRGYSPSVHLGARPVVPNVATVFSRALSPNVTGLATTVVPAVARATSRAYAPSHYFPTFVVGVEIEWTPPEVWGDWTSPGGPIEWTSPDERS